MNWKAFLIKVSLLLLNNVYCRQSLVKLVGVYVCMCVVELIFNAFVFREFAFTNARWKNYPKIQILNAIKLLLGENLYYYLPPLTLPFLMGHKNIYLWIVTTAAQA